MKKAIKSLYGNVVILKGWCSDCKGYYFVLNGELQCCGKHFELPEEEITKRESKTWEPRGFSKKDKEYCLNEQNHCCIYCGIGLNDSYWDGKRKRYISAEIHFDHFIPYVYSQNNSKSNIIASCHICNLIKSSKCFPSIDEARVYIQSRREAKKLELVNGHKKG